MILCLVFLGMASKTWGQERWSVERAKAWHDKHGWLVGANYIPAYAINQLEMWQIGTFDLERIDLTGPLKATFCE